MCALLQIVMSAEKFTAARLASERESEIVSEKKKVSERQVLKRGFLPFPL